MPRKSSNLLFNSIAAIYGLFYQWQKRGFLRIIDVVQLYEEIGNEFYGYIEEIYTENQFNRLGFKIFYGSGPQLGPNNGTG